MISASKAMRRPMAYSTLTIPYPTTISFPVKPSKVNPISCPPLAPVTSKIFQPVFGRPFSLQYPLNSLDTALASLSVELMQKSAPKLSALSSFSWLRAIPTTVFAPSALAVCPMYWPTPPVIPITTTLSPGCKSALLAA